MHAFLSPSKYHWINYDEEKLCSTYINHLAIQKGNDLHELARQCILLGIKLPRTKNALNQYVNDAIGYRMTPEQPLFYSYNAFGTADTISFREKLLRIHDLKSGATLASMHQLEVYAALFCLEYGYKPFDIEMELRIYQMTDVLVGSPEPQLITDIMDKIIVFDKKIEAIRKEDRL
jgi:hypothetical protein